MHTELSLPAIGLERRAANRGIFFSWQLVPFLLLWAAASWGPPGHWMHNPQYQYGWLVPFFALFSGYKRWQDRPAPEKASNFGLWIAVLGCVLLLPSWLFLQPNRAWPFLNWLFVAQIVAILLGTIAAIGGGSWVRHFAFPVALIFTAVPWLDAIESPLMQYLMRIVASIAVAFLDISGVTAIQHGNLLEVTGGVVGIDQACSGIRSLQGALMAAIFLGELFHFRVPRRLVLIGVSLLAAFATNVLRVAFLAWSAASSGAAAVDRWHDPAGMAILGICVTVILVVALVIDREPLVPPASAAVAPAHPLPAGFALDVLVWGGLVLLFTEIWYFDGGKPPASPSTVALPSDSKLVRVPPSAQAQLLYDGVSAASWSEPGGKTWAMYFFDWKYGPSFARVAAQMHRPDVCLPAAGRTLIADRGVISFQSGSRPLPFHSYVVIISGYDGAEEADEAFARALPSLITGKEGASLSVNERAFLINPLRI